MNSPSGCQRMGRNETLRAKGADGKLFFRRIASLGGLFTGYNLLFQSLHQSPLHSKVVHTFLSLSGIKSILSLSSLTILIANISSSWPSDLVLSLSFNTSSFSLWDF